MCFILCRSLTQLYRSIDLVDTYAAWEREWLYWFDENGDRYLSPDEQAAQERRLREALLAKLRDRGIDPNTL